MSIIAEKDIKGYVIDFGRFKGERIVDMGMNYRRYSYCCWLYKELIKQMDKSERDCSLKFQAFSWAVRRLGSQTRHYS